MRLRYDEAQIKSLGSGIQRLISSLFLLSSHNLSMIEKFTVDIICKQREKLELEISHSTPNALIIAVLDHVINFLNFSSWNFLG